MSRRGVMRLEISSGLWIRLRAKACEQHQSIDTIVERAIRRKLRSGEQERRRRVPDGPPRG